MSHCFERRFAREIEDLSQENKTEVSYEISIKEQKLYSNYEKIIAKVVIPMDGYDIILYMNEYYPFIPPYVVIRRDKHSKEFMNEWNENIKQSVFEYIGDDDHEYFTIQSFTCYQMDLYCTNQEEKEIFLKWKYQFDSLWFNRSKYAASLRLKEMIPDIIQLMYLIQIQKERYLTSQI
jgi:hypothetical protein